MPEFEKTPEQPSIRVGIAGWSYPDWVGTVYPKPMTRGMTELKMVASWFDIAEINTSFYQIPPPRMAEGWLNQVADFPQFRFSAKLFQEFTHDRSIDRLKAEAFHDFLRPLDESDRLEALLIQFPWSFKASSSTWDHACRLFDEFQRYPLVLEVRHDSWWKEGFFEKLRTLGVSISNVDQPSLKQNIAPDEQLTGPIAYVRFHGRNEQYWWAEKEPYYGARYHYLYNKEELDPWINRIKRLSLPAQSTIIIMNNHFRGDAAVNGMEIAAMLNGAKGEIPRCLYEAYPERLTKLGLPIESPPPKQGDLFE